PAAGGFSSPPTCASPGAVVFALLAPDAGPFTAPGARGTAMNVNVTARNDARLFGAAVNLAFSSGFSVAGGVDVGLVRNDTTATIGGNVTAVDDIAVHAIGREQVDSFVGSLGYTSGGIGVIAS